MKTGKRLFPIIWILLLLIFPSPLALADAGLGSSYSLDEVAMAKQVALSYIKERVPVYPDWDGAEVSDIPMGPKIGHGSPAEPPPGWTPPPGYEKITPVPPSPPPAKEPPVQDVPPAKMKSFSPKSGEKFRRVGQAKRTHHYYPPSLPVLLFLPVEARHAVPRFGMPNLYNNLHSFIHYSNRSPFTFPLYLIAEC